MPYELKYSISPSAPLDFHALVGLGRRKKTGRAISCYCTRVLHTVILTVKSEELELNQELSGER